MLIEDVSCSEFVVYWFARKSLKMASADSSLCISESSIYEANLVTILPQEVIEKLAELDLELSEGKQRLKHS